MTKQERHGEDEVLDRYYQLLVADPSQWALGRKGGRYIRLKRPFTAQVRDQMLQGQLSVALYMLTPHGHAIQGVVDSDKEEGLVDLQRLGHKLREFGLNPILEASRRGGHLRIFHQPISPAVTTLLLHKSAALFSIEADIFPRGKGLSAVRAPFSVHPKTWERYPLLHLDTLQPVAGTLEGQLRFLSSVKRPSAETMANALASVLAEADKPARPQFSGSLRDKPEILTVVSQDLAVKRVGKYYRALCPFHDDTEPSLVLYPETGTFFCFGCRKTGDAIHYMALRQGVRDGEIIKGLKGN